MKRAASGDLPMISALSGDDADELTQLTYRLEGLGVAWVLLLLGPPGWFVLALIARAKGGATVKLPLTTKEARRLAWLADARVRGAWGAVGFGAVALAIRGAPYLSLIVGMGALLCLIIAVYATVVLPWQRPSIHVDQGGTRVTLLAAPERFGQAVAKT